MRGGGAAGASGVAFGAGGGTGATGGNAGSGATGVGSPLIDAGVSVARAIATGGVGALAIGAAYGFGIGVVALVNSAYGSIVLVVEVARRVFTTGATVGRSLVGNVATGVAVAAGGGVIAVYGSIVLLALVVGFGPSGVAAAGAVAAYGSMRPRLTWPLGARATGLADLVSLGAAATCCALAHIAMTVTVKRIAVVMVLPFERVWHQRQLVDKSPMDSTI